MNNRNGHISHSAFMRQAVVLLVLAGTACFSARADGLRESERRNAYAMLQGVHTAIARSYFDANYKGLNLDALADVAKSRIAKADSVADALAAIAQFELELDDLHTTFMPPWLTISVDYGWAMGMVGNDCYVIHLDPKSDAARQGVAIGDKVKSVNGFVPARANLWQLNYLFNDLHPLPGLHVELTSPAGQTRTLDLAGKVHQQGSFLDLSMTSDGMDRSRFEQEADKYWMQLKPVTVRSVPDVLLIRMPSFLMSAGEVKRQFHEMHDRVVLILDLRGNGGGEVEALDELLGEIFSDNLNLATRQARGKSEPWVINGTGKNAYSGRVLVLVDAQSASASELFARAMQLTDRGTVIGDQTMGAVMEAKRLPYALSNGENVIVYGTSVTVADIVMSDGGHLEKTGVTPDFVVLPSADDLNAGRDPALAQALSFAGHPMDATAAAKLFSNH